MVIDSAFRYALNYFVVNSIIKDIQVHQGDTPNLLGYINSHAEFA